MARLLQSGAELQSATSGVEIQSVSGSGLTIDTTTKRSGNASFKFTSNASESRYGEWTWTAAVVYARMYVRFSAFPTDATGAILQLINGANVCGCIAIKTTGKLALYDGNIAGAQRGSDSSTLSLNTWYCIELTANNGAGTELDARLDGSSFASGAMTYAGNAAGIDFGFVDWQASAVMYVDDVIVNSSSGSYNNSWVGMGEKLVLALPAGAGDFAADAGTYSCINEIPPSNTATTGSTMIELDTTTSKGDYTVTSPSTLGLGNDDLVRAISVIARVREESAGTSNYTMRIKSASGGTVTASSSVDAGNATARTNPSSTTAFGVTLISETDPTTASPWTVGGTNSLTNMQIGAATTDGTPDTWVLWLGAYIGYVPVTSPSITKGLTYTITTTPATVTKQLIYEIYDATQVDGFNCASNPQTLTLNTSGDYKVGGQSFTGDGGVLANAQFNLYKTSSPTGSIYAKIYAHSGTFGTDSVPTGSPLATSDAVDVSTLGGSAAWVTFTFTGANKITLTAATRYVVVIDAASIAATGNVLVATDYASTTHPGNMVLYFDAWEADGTYETLFKVHKDTGATSTTMTKGLVYTVTTTPTTLTKGLVYSILTTPATITKALAYAITATPATPTKALVYTVTTTPATKTKSMAYAVTITPATITKGLVYSITTTPATITKGLQYYVQPTAATITKGLVYAVQGTPATKTKTLQYTVTTTPATLTKALTYAIQASNAAITKGLQYTVIITPATVTKALAYTVQSSHAAVTKGLVYTVTTTAATLTKALAYTVQASVAAITKALVYTIQAAPSTPTKALQYTIIVTPATKTAPLVYCVQPSTTISTGLEYSIVGASPILTKSLGYAITATVSKTAALVYTIVTTGSATKGLEYRVSPATTPTKQLVYAIVTTPATLTKTLAYAVVPSTTATKGLVYTVQAPHTITTGLQYAVSGATTTETITAPLAYCTVTPHTVTKALTYAISPTESITKVLAYLITAPHTLTLGMAYTVTKSATQTKPLGYYVVFHTTVTDVLAYTVITSPIKTEPMKYRINLKGLYRYNRGSYAQDARLYAGGSSMYGRGSKLYNSTGDKLYNQKERVTP